MSALGEIEQRMLAVLEEAGEEDGRILINDVFQPTGDPKELELFHSALRKLIAVELAIMGVVGVIPVVFEKLSAAASAKYADEAMNWFKFDQSSRLWQYAEEPTPGVELLAQDLDDALKLAAFPLRQMFKARNVEISQDYPLCRPYRIIIAFDAKAPPPTRQIWGNQR